MVWGWWGKILVHGLNSPSPCKFLVTFCRREGLFREILAWALVWARPWSSWQSLESECCKAGICLQVRQKMLSILLFIYKWILKWNSKFCSAIQKWKRGFLLIHRRELGVERNNLPCTSSWAFSAQPLAACSTVWKKKQKQKAWDLIFRGGRGGNKRISECPLAFKKQASSPYGWERLKRM